MKTIHILSEEVRQKIAAGEVVERPSSIVKELVENSLDAGARKIRVSISDGGLREIVVSDDGHGISREDKDGLFLRYATSKIESDEDLFRIDSFGFRGEALSSIAAVSKATLRSRSTNDETGFEVTIEGGEEKSYREIAQPVGTEIIVKDVFYNIPARKKFQKSVLAETKKSIKTLSDIALMHPEVGFVIIANGKTFFDLPKQQSSRSRIRALLGADVERGLIPISYEEAPFRVDGFVSKPRGAKKTRKNQYLFINSRPVEDKSLAFRVKNSFRTLLSERLHPVFVLNITIPKHMVDINVHPRKLEVAFENPKRISDVLSSAIKMGLSIHNIVPTAHFGLPMTDEELPVSSDNTITSFGGREPRILREEAITGYGVHSGAPLFHDSTFSKESGFEPLFQLFSAYILARKEEKLYVIDQHAAEERAMYEKLLSNYEQKIKETQPLMMPITLDLTPTQRLSIESYLDFFEKIGVHIEQFGEETYLIRSVPKILTKKNIHKMVLGILEEEGDVRNKKLSEDEESILIKRACTLSVKAGEHMDFTRMNALLTNLMNCKTPYTCPHGRPTIIELEESSFEKLFLRK